jgi:hypothetical protein
MVDRPRCIKDDCNNLAKINYRKGNKSYYKLCTTHLREYYGKKDLYNKRDLERKKQNYDLGIYVPKNVKIDRSFCSICGWNKTVCDQHRIIFGCNGGKYIKGNLISLCPNCHRLVHRGLLTIK